MNQDVKLLEYVINSVSEGDKDLDGNVGAFWSNQDGWGHFDSATRFVESERSLALPVSKGGDAKWLTVQEVIAMRSADQVGQKERPRVLVVDGADESGVFAGDGENAPFVVFDVDRQENIAGPYETREAANTARAAILSGAAPTLDARMLSAMLAALDEGAASVTCTGSAAIANRLLVTVDQKDGENVLVALAPEGLSEVDVHEAVRKSASSHAEYSDLSQDLSEQGFVVFHRFMTVDI